MAQQNINIGTSANKGDGDPIRTAFTKVNANFTELFARHDGSIAHVTDIKGSVFGDDSTTLVDGLNSKINLDGTVKGNIIPDTDVIYDIGSSTHRFKDLYLSGNTIHLGSNQLSVDNDGNFEFSGSIKAQPILGDDSTLLVDTTNSKLVLTNNTTTDLSEGTNLYYTDARADARITAATTTDLSEGTNLYYTDTRVDSHINQSNPTSGYVLSWSGSDYAWIEQSGGEGETNESSFKTISVDGQSDVVADTTTDTLSFEAGSNMTITTNAGTDTVTFAAASGGGGGWTEIESDTPTTQTLTWSTLNLAAYSVVRLEIEDVVRSANTRTELSISNDGFSSIDTWAQNGTNSFDNSGSFMADGNSTLTGGNGEYVVLTPHNIWASPLRWSGYIDFRVNGNAVVMTGQGISTDDGPCTVLWSGMCAVTTFTDLKLHCFNGTFSSGTFRLLGMA